MKNNDNFELNTNKNVDDAQAVNKSELLPIYEAMNFSGDIQPLEYTPIPDYEKTEVLNDRNDFQKSDIKKKKRSVSTILNKKYRKLIVAAVCAVIVLSVVTGAVIFAVESGKNDSYVQSVYTSENKNIILLSDGDAYSISDAQEVKVSDGGRMLYYTTPTDSKTGNFDLKVVDIEKKKSLKKGGSYIDNGIDEDWYINSDGSFMCYSKTDKNVKSYYLYSAEEGTTELISEDAEEVFLPGKGDVVYFTRRISSIYSLHRKRFGEDSQNVASEIGHVAFYDSEEGFEVLYTADSEKDDVVDIFSVKNFDAPATVCEGISEVYMNNYSVTGNLYYFKKETSNVDWKDFINDPYADNDATLERPVEGDYMINVGFLFDRYVLDYNSFNAADKKYKAKLLRDDIRNELDSLDLGLAVKDTYTCYVYNGSEKEIATGVMLENVLGFSDVDSPRLIYAKSVIEVENKIEMDNLVKLAKKEDVASAIDYVKETVSDSYGLSDECIYTWYDSKRVIELTVDEYDVEKTEYILGSKNSLYALSDGKLYHNAVSTKAIEKGKLIDSDIADCEYIDGYLYYTKEDDLGRISLFRHSADGNTEHIADNLYSYFVVEKDYVILLSRQQSGTELMDVAVYTADGYKEIDKDVSLNNFIFNSKGMAYIKNSGAYDTYEAGDMYVYTPENGVSEAISNVTEIFYVNKS
ncbi:MAG: hypothetical protein J6L62_00070 [Clostridia bacterium]|nr:hypothetical protein [Clostridia bacterium]